MVSIDYKNIGEHLKNTAPYIFVDKAEVEPGISSDGVKNFTHNEWFFQCHFPDEPIVPGVFQIEAITQTAALAVHTLEGMEGKKILLKKFNSVDFLNGVYPGDQLMIKTKINSFRRGIIKASGEAGVYRGGQFLTTCKADFNMIVPALFSNLSPVSETK